jgi:hypothetical protein
MEIPFNCKIAGAAQSERLKLLKYVDYHSKFILEREPLNDFDSNAIRVMLPVRKGKQKLQLGYIPAKKAVELAPLMDQGEKFSGRFVFKIIDETTGEHRGVIIKVLRNE